MIWKLVLIVFLLGQCIKIQAIIGGQVAEAPIPWQVSIQIPIRNGTYTNLCGGTLVDSKTIISAAHCFGEFSEGTYVTAGSISIGSGHVVKIEKALSNPYKPFNRTTLENDIVLLKLEREIPFKEDFIQPACLPETNFKPSNETTCYVSGWGKSNNNDLNDLQDDPNKPLVLRWAKVPVIEECEKYIGAIICASDESRGACYGDSGGPLVCLGEDNSFVIAGVVSNAGGGCADPKHPTFHTSITHHLDWIKSNMEQVVNRGEKKICSLPRWMESTQEDDDRNKAQHFSKAYKRGCSYWSRTYGGFYRDFEKKSPKRSFIRA